MGDVTPSIWKPSELLSYVPPHVPWIVEPLIRPGGVAVVFGPREAGKTQFLLTLVRAIQTQTLLLERFKTSTVKVALVEVDMPFGETQERLKRAATEFTFSDDLFRLVTVPDFDILKTPAILPWVAELRRFGPQLVLFDSLRKIHREKEQDTAVPSAVYSKVKELFPGAGFLFTHHVVKPPADWIKKQHSYDEGEDMHTYRGTTAWLDDADTALFMRLSSKGKRSLKVTRCRAARDDIKRDIIGVTIGAESMFLEAGALSQEQWVKSWVLKNPDASQEVGEAAAAAQFPGHHRTTYFRWVRDALRAV